MAEHEDRLQRVADKKTARIRESLTKGNVDLFLWKGSKAPTLSQRFGAWIIGLFFGSIGVAFWFFIRGDDPRILKLIPVALILLGAKVFRNGFNRKTGIP